jgi:arylsulfatase
MERTVPLILPIDKTFDIGADTGTLNKLTSATDRPKPTPKDEKRLREASQQD